MELTFTGTTTTVVPIEDETQVGQARRVAQQLAQVAGFSEADAARVALVATELSSNVFKHARGGEIHVSRVHGRDVVGIEVTAIDRGPGFDLARCLPDGYSTGGTRGEGLGAVQRQAQVLDVHADAKGAVVMARMYPKGAAQADLAYGASMHRLPDESECGDGWGLTYRDQSVCAMVVDGLGHGAAASVAAEACVRGYVANPCEEPSVLMAALNASMTGTRGGAVAVARYDRGSGALRYAGIGNIAASLQAPEGSRGLASHPGIVGLPGRPAVPFDFSSVQGRLLVMHSDGLQSRWSLSSYHGLVYRHPAVVAAVLYRDFNRGRDDTTVLAVRLEGGA
jgi:anti-sigma regulatory factor (Ser/Thr protein kinase)